MAELGEMGMFSLLDVLGMERRDNEADEIVLYYIYSPREQRLTIWSSLRILNS